MKFRPCRAAICRCASPVVGAACSRVCRSAAEDDDDREKGTFGVHESPRGGKGALFGWDVTKTFCARNGLGLIVRSHQSKQDQPHMGRWGT